MRPSIDSTMLAVASILAQRATCRKLKVGCVLVDAKNKILGTGYNGVPGGMVHCTDQPCAGMHAPKGSDLCEAVHAEQNALLQCSDVTRIDTAYVTHAPCMRCTKLLLNTSCRDIVFFDDLHTEEPAERLWKLSCRNWYHFEG
jgi:dCMP deaminase